MRDIQTDAQIKTPHLSIQRSSLQPGASQAGIALSVSNDFVSLLSVTWHVGGERRSTALCTLNLPI